MSKNNEKITDQQVDFSIAEKWNGIAAIVGCVAAFASYSFTGFVTHSWFSIMEVLIVLAAVAASAFGAYKMTPKSLQN